MVDVTVPTGETVRFPDDMPKEQIKQLLVSKFPELGQQQAQPQAQEQPRSPVRQIKEPPKLLPDLEDAPQEVGRALGLTARAGIEGLASPVTFIGDTVNTLINQVAGTNLGQPSEFLSEGLTDLGLPSPETGAEKVVGAIGQGVSGIGGISAISKGIQSAAPNVAKFLAESPATQAGGVTGAVVGGEVAEELGFGETGQLVGTLIGGLAGGGLASRGDIQLKTPVPNSQELRKKANQVYKAAEQKGGVLNAKFTDSFIDEAEKILLPADDLLRTLDANKPLVGAFKDISKLKNEPMTLERAQNFDELLGDMIDGFTELGKVNKQGKKLLDVQSKLRTMIKDAPASSIDGGKEGFELVSQGRKLWSTSAKLSDVERIIQRAELMDNPAQGIKSGFRTMLNNPNRLRGFSKEERKAIKNAAESGVVTDLFRTFGSRLLPIVTTASGGGIGGTALATAGSIASRDSATRLQLGRANVLADLIATQGKQQAKRSTLPPTALGVGIGAISRENN